MANYMSMETLRFLLYSVHKAEELFQYERYAGYDRTAMDILLDAAKDWADQDYYPYFKEMDEHPAYYKDGKVHTHPIVKKIFKKGGEDGWIGAYFDAEDGGMQMPYTFYNAAIHIFQAANNHLPGYIGLTSGAAHLIASFGSNELKKKFIPPMLAGEWSGTMALTEPQSGSSLSHILTSAHPTDQPGLYKIKGQKIFISGGDHEGTDNFVHLTLARIEGAPEGTKGISLFVVPKLMPQADGSLVDNDVHAVADFQKMGQRGYSTVHLVYGEQDHCYGYLVGEAHHGLKYMFQMMNGARIDVGLSSASTAAAAYYASLQYARERLQGARLLNAGEKPDSKEQTLIIHHPDVRRMLLLQKAVVEGSLSLLMECSKYNDIAQSDSSEKGKDAHLLLELLTPIAKTYPAEMGRVAIDNGLQVLGGYGFCTDFPLQQYLRDVRIMAIYEGTTAIHSLDLLGRKIPMENGKAIKLLSDRVTATIMQSMSYPELAPYGKVLGEKAGVLQKTLEYLMGYAMKGDIRNYLADANIFMELASTIVIAYQWLKMAVAAQQALNEGDTTYSADFYRGKVHTMKFFFKYELPKVDARKEILMSDDKLTIFEDENEVIFN